MSADDTSLDLPRGMGNSENLSHFMAKPVLHSEENKDTFTLCRQSGVEAVRGQCPVHMSDACLSLFVRYNHVFEVMEKNFKNAMVETRRAMK